MEQSYEYGICKLKLFNLRVIWNYMKSPFNALYHLNLHEQSLYCFIFTLNYMNSPFNALYHLKLHEQSLYCFISLEITWTVPLLLFIFFSESIKALLWVYRYSCINGFSWVPISLIYFIFVFNIQQYPK